MQTKHISVRGVVQGVGFRPFVYAVATRLGLRGWVCNTSGGVEIVIEGEPASVTAFVQSLSAKAPPLARIDQMLVRDGAGDHFERFEIRESESIQGAFQPVSADVAICPDCERELFDPRDRRYLYPFINCTNCGPRFTIIKDLPYDRPQTTMADFQMCVACETEYRDPLDRRFHAQPVACPQCGPDVWLVCSDAKEPVASRAAVLAARRLLREGKILAVKGLGGFHLACDAANPSAVNELRRRKGRVDKPFAVMAADLATVGRFCELGDAQRTLLTGHEKPILLLRRRPQVQFAESISPSLDTAGVMLPYTPLHHLLLNQCDPVLRAEPVPPVLVMTSGNFSEEPIATDNQQALEQLAPLADAFLLHNREIHIRCDDSVVRVDERPRTRGQGKTVVHRPSPALPACASAALDCPAPNAGRCPPGQAGTGAPVPPWTALHRTQDGVRQDRQAGVSGAEGSVIYLRRSRGYAPYPVQLPFETRPTLAVGGELKNTFCLTRERYAFLSHHIGDMENAETYESFEQGVEHLSRLFRVQPELIAYDLHPGYVTTAYAQRSTLNVRRLGVQHHHAHIASCMADSGLENRKVIGLSFDGTGYGTDGAIWGGEVLVADYADFERVAHLEYLPLPGGDAAIRHPWRIAVGYAAALGLAIDDLPFIREMDGKAVAILRQQVEKRLNAPLTSSLGRLFDAVASLAGVRADVTYEAQAAIELEVLSRPYLSGAKPYPYGLDESRGMLIVRLKDLLAAVVAAVRRGESPGQVGARFHRTIAMMAADICGQIRQRTELTEVALSGGVWQNQLLLDLARSGLEKEGFTVYFHRQTPPNDGGLALGQAAVANHQIG